MGMLKIYYLAMTWLGLKRACKYTCQRLRKTALSTVKQCAEHKGTTSAFAIDAISDMPMATETIKI